LKGTKTVLFLQLPNAITYATIYRILVLATEAILTQRSRQIGSYIIGPLRISNYKIIRFIIKIISTRKASSLILGILLVI
jgi:hypothetical protein